VRGADIHTAIGVRLKAHERWQGSRVGHVCPRMRHACRNATTTAGRRTSGTWAAVRDEKGPRRPQFALPQEIIRRRMISLRRVSRVWVWLQIHPPAVVEAARTRRGLLYRRKSNGAVRFPGKGYRGAGSVAACPAPGLPGCVGATRMRRKCARRRAAPTGSGACAAPTTAAASTPRAAARRPCAATASSSSARSATGPTSPAGRAPRTSPVARERLPATAAGSTPPPVGRPRAAATAWSTVRCGAWPSAAPRCRCRASCATAPTSARHSAP